MNLELTRTTAAASTAAPHELALDCTAFADQVAHAPREELPTLAQRAQELTQTDAATAAKLAVALRDRTGDTLPSFKASLRGGLLLSALDTLAQAERLTAAFESRESTLHLSDVAAALERLASGNPHLTDAIAAIAGARLAPLTLANLPYMLANEALRRAVRPYAIAKNPKSRDELEKARPATEREISQVHAALKRDFAHRRERAIDMSHAPTATAEELMGAVELDAAPSHSVSATHAEAPPLVQFFFRHPSRSETRTLELPANATRADVRAAIAAAAEVPADVLAIRDLDGDGPFDLASLKEHTFSTRISAPPVLNRDGYTRAVLDEIGLDLAALSADTSDSQVVFVGIGSCDQGHGAATIARQQCPTDLLTACLRDGRHFTAMVADHGFADTAQPQIWDIDQGWQEQHSRAGGLVREFRYNGDAHVRLLVYATPVLPEEYLGQRTTFGGSDLRDVAAHLGAHAYLCAGNFYDATTRPTVESGVRPY